MLIVDILKKLINVNFYEILTQFKYSYDYINEYLYKKTQFLRYLHNDFYVI